MNMVKQKEKRKLATKSYLIHQRMDDGWKLVKKTQNPAEIHPLEWWYFNHIMREDLDYLVVGDTMYDIIYHNEYL